MSGVNYVKYVHRRKRYAITVINNTFKSPNFKIRDKTIFFIEPDVEISKDIEKKEIEKTVKEGERKILNRYHEHIETNKKNGIGVMERKRTGTRVKIGSKLITGRKRVAFFTIDGYFGGPAVHSYNIIKMFIKNGVEFDVFSFGFGKKKNKGLLNDLGIRIYPTASIDFGKYNIFHVQANSA
ncbi:unnamed protein product, partial [marine sediment metagenome]